MSSTLPRIAAFVTSRRSQWASQGGNIPASVTPSDAHGFAYTIRIAESNLDAALADLNKAAKSKFTLAADDFNRITRQPDKLVDINLSLAESTLLYDALKPKDKGDTSITR